jgi:hypothetical protein
MIMHTQQTGAATTAKSLDQLKVEIIATSKRGYPILVAGALFFLVLALLPAIMPLRTVQLIWVLGLIVIFPVGILLGQLLGIEVITRNNPLGTLGGLIAGTQAFYLPVFIAVYQFQPDLLPLTIGVLGWRSLPSLCLVVQQSCLPLRVAWHRASGLHPWRSVHSVIAPARPAGDCARLCRRDLLDPTRESAGSLMSPCGSQPEHTTLPADAGLKLPRTQQASGDSSFPIGRDDPAWRLGVQSLPPK